MLVAFSLSVEYLDPLVDWRCKWRLAALLLVVYFVHFFYARFLVVGGVGDLNPTSLSPMTSSMLPWILPLLRSFPGVAARITEGFFGRLTLGLRSSKAALAGVASLCF